MHFLVVSLSHLAARAGNRAARARTPSLWCRCPIWPRGPATEPRRRAHTFLVVSLSHLAARAGDRAAKTHAPVRAEAGTQRWWAQGSHGDERLPVHATQMSHLMVTRPFTRCSDASFPTNSWKPYSAPATEYSDTQIGLVPRSGRAN
jgi:hypothetical protein